MIFITNFWQLTTSMAPYLLFGFFLSGLLSRLITSKMVERHLQKQKFSSVIKGSLLGVPLPLCSCGVLPMAMTLKKQGASNAAVISFITSTPQTGVDSFLVTYSLLGPCYALIRLFVAFTTGIITGLSIVFWGKDKEEKKSACCCQSKLKEEGCCSKKQDDKSSLKDALRYGLIEMPRSLGKEILLGLILGTLILSFTSANLFTHQVSPLWLDSRIGSGFLGMLLMLLVGLPIYVCSTASVPIAVGLFLSGFSPGAVLVFLVTGPATNIVTITTLVKNIGLRNTIIYLLSLIMVTFGFGFLVDYLNITAEVAQNVFSCTKSEPGIINIICAVVLLCLFISGVRKRS